uniref:Uncharacterized protein n=1 Tax=Cajanus cajan TaxID=3821 RepID=A0A151TF53_CAJCA|nr:hypothetical protein KK1_011950 [Cajanus cajan]
MDRSGRYDVSRVPSSIFEANTNPLEWSIGSNDSLFSIQLGQPSFSREKALICGELSLLEDLTKLSGSNNKISSVIEEEIETTLKNVVENLQATKTSQGSLKLEGEGIDEANDEIETLDETKSFKSSKFIISCLSNNIGTGMSTSDFPM